MTANDITKLDEKYIVVKWEDVFNHNILTTEECDDFRGHLYRISEYRKKAGKPSVRYLVLNLDDELVIDHLIDRLESHKKDLKTPYIAVNDIAVDLVNAVLRAGNPKS